MRPSGRQLFNNLHNEALHHLTFRGIHTGPENAARLLHRSLQEVVDRTVEERDLVEIAPNIRSLVQYFVGKKNFEQARKYLSIADWIAERVKSKEQLKTDLRRRFAFSRLDYFAALLQASLDKLQERKRVLILSRNVAETDDHFSFNTNMRNMILEHENQYPVVPGRDWNETSILFIAAKKEVGLALKYFDITNTRTEHANIMQIQSKMYNSLAAFQYEKIASIEAVTKLSKIQRRRVKGLESCLMELKTPDDVVKIQEISFELTEIYLDMLELKQKKFERTAGNLDPRLLQKMVWIII